MALRNPSKDRRSASRGATAEDRRQRILEATLDVIAQGGVDSVSHRRVAAAAGVPLGSTTYYFESRAHLIHEAFAAHLDRSRAILDIDSASDFGDVEDAVESIAAAVAREYAERDRLLAEYEMTLYAARDAELARILGRFDAAVRKRFTDGFGALGMDDPEGAARSVLQLIRGHQLEQLMRGDEDLEDLQRRLRTLLRALIADPDAPQRRPNRKDSP